MSAGQQMAAATPDKVRVTHVEIRRVQNGFVVMAVDYADSDKYASQRYENLVKASFVAKDEEEVKTVIGNLLISAELQWLPTCDIPMLWMNHRQQKAEQELAQLRAQIQPPSIPLTIGSPIPPAPPGSAYYGGLLGNPIR